MEEEKTIDVVVQEYEDKITTLNSEHAEELKKLKEEHAKEIRAIISGRKSIPENVGNQEEKEEKDFFTTEIEKTRKKLKIKKEEEN